MSQTARPVAARYELAVLVAAMVLPSLVTWLYFVALAESPTLIQQLAYAMGKAIQFALPVVWVLLLRREKLRFARPTMGGLMIGVASGLAILLAMLALYQVWLKPADWFEMVAVPVREKVAGMGVDSVWRFAALGTFYALLHSLAEEYYWRWFVFGRMQRLMSWQVAAAISSLGFMAHHVLLLGTYFGYTSAAAWVFSLCIAVGGFFWAWLYHRTGTLVGPWVSHLLVDAGIFLIGYDIVWAGF